MSTATPPTPAASPSISSRGNTNGARAKDTAPPPSPRSFSGFSEITSFLWSVADLLRGDYKQADYGKVILPLTVIRRLDCVLDKTKAKVLAKHVELKQAKHPEGTVEKMLLRASGNSFYNTSKLDFEKLKGDPNNIAANLTSYIKGFSPTARDVIDQFKFAEQIAKLDDANLLFQVVAKFADVDLHPEKIPNHVMGSVFEELIRRFAEASNETAGEHFTPREVIRLMVDLLFIEDEETLTKKGIVRTLYDPAAGTGGMLSVAEEYLRELNPDAELKVYGQELNGESYAICKSDMMIKGQNPENIIRGNSFSEDGHPTAKFDYMLSNPPFGVEWKKVQKEVEQEHETQGFAGRFGPGLPRINDGSMLFLLHMISKMKPVDPKTGEGGSRIAIVFNGSPLFTGDAGSGESEIRKWIIENDWLEAIVALPDQLFYNTGISTYVWLVTNRKPKSRKGKVQLVNGAELFQKMRKSLGNKRNELGKGHIETVTKTYGEFLANDLAKVFNNEDFGFRRIAVERPLRLNFQTSPERIELLRQESAFVGLAKTKKKGAAGEREAEEGRATQEKIVAALGTMNGAKIVKNRDAFEKELRALFQKAKLDVPTPVFKAVLSALSERDETADVCTDTKGRPEPDADLRDTENVPLKEDIRTYFDREVKATFPDAWIDEGRTAVGYEIPFTRHFYRYAAPMALKDVAAEILAGQEDLRRALQGFIEGEFGEVALRGMDPAVPMRDTGVPWLGSVPAHWRTVRLGDVVDVVGGATPSKERPEFWEGNIPWVSPKDMKRPVLSDAEDHVSELAVRRTALRLVKPPAVLMVIRGMILAHTVPVALTAAPLTVNQDMKALLPRRELVAEYLAHLLRTINPALLARVEEAGHGTKCLRTEQWRKVEVVVPPVEEQRLIALWLDGQQGHTSSVSAALAGLTSMLDEFYSGRAYAAASGKLDLRRRV